MSNIQIVILAGGLGSRLREETEFRPKTLVPIQEIPILGHIIEIYARQGFNEFIVCAGYLGEKIHQYFLIESMKFHSEIQEFDEKSRVYQYSSPISETLVKVRVVDTGEDTLAGGRIFKAREYISGPTFACTYGDGVGNVDISQLLLSHMNGKVSGTVTAVKPPSRFGILEINDSNLITGFMEKPESFWVSGGFFIFQSEIFAQMDDNVNLELTVLQNLTQQGHLNAYLHRGFWYPMDTQRDYEMLNEIAMENSTLPWLSGL
jgi:glucose-1-phosphate cytidylyltransferase